MIGPVVRFAILIAICVTVTALAWRRGGLRAATPAIGSALFLLAGFLFVSGLLDDVPRAAAGTVFLAGGLVAWSRWLFGKPV